MSRIDGLADRASDLGGRAYDWADERFDLDSGRAFLGKAFPAEDSFLLGEIALFCFLSLVLTGLALASDDPGYG
jgi:cytochrome b-561